MARTIFLVSDRTGITIETLAHTLLTQFDAVHHKSVSLPFIDDPAKARKVVDRVNTAADQDPQPPLVFSSIVDPALRDILRQSRGAVLDMFDIYVPLLERELSVRSRQAVGLAHAIDDISRYEHRVDAINYTLSHDDGGKIKQLQSADVILLGVSRSGKTPTCLYLALHYGVSAANYPLTEEDMDNGRLPEFLTPYKKRWFGLTITPERLHRIRTERRPDSRYASIEQCRKEVQWAENVFRRYQAPFIDTTAISIEEIAVNILDRFGLRRESY
jgi:regulator of PEP synthase PpsR (kinase-PPPase family)